jgi:hypothetical protein
VAIAVEEASSAEGVAKIGLGLSFWLLVGSCSLGVYYAPQASRVSAAVPSDETAAVETKPTDKAQEQPAVQQQQAANDTSENTDSAPEPSHQADAAEQAARRSARK